VSRRHKVRGRVYRTSRGSWAGEVLVNGVVVESDGTGSWWPIYRQVDHLARALEDVANSGHGTVGTPKLLREATKKGRKRD
jgi:hypothetical protein